MVGLNDCDKYWLTKLKYLLSGHLEENFFVLYLGINFIFLQISFTYVLQETHFLKELGSIFPKRLKSIWSFTFTFIKCRVENLKNMKKHKEPNNQLYSYQAKIFTASRLFLV